MPLTDTLVSAREGLLNRLLRVRADCALNPAPTNPTPVPASQIAADLKRAVNAFKATAIDADGLHVDYARLRASPAYTEYCRKHVPLLRNADLTTLTTRAERLAFWINLYNALVIHAVIAFDIRTSVTEGPLGILRFFRCAAYNVGGLRFSCDDIEHGLLRANRGHPYLPGPQFSPSDPRRALVITPPDPRIHFALNCASRSCPPIGVYDAADLDTQLDLTTRNYLDAEVKTDSTRGRLHLPAILKWFAGDLGDLRTFLLRYLPDGERRAWLQTDGKLARLTFQPYNWSLNL